MIFKDEEKAKEILLDIGYYRLGFYWYFFEIDTNAHNRIHLFQDNTFFEDSVALYYFDTDLRNLLSIYLHRFEVNLRTHIIYLLSNKYKKNPTWFADRKIVNYSFTNQTLPSTYLDIKRRNKVILNHHTKHINDRYAPAWKTLEYMTFGCILKLYDNLKDEADKRLISEQYSIKNPNVFSSYLEGIRQLRNKCAHGHPIFSLALPKPIKKGNIPLLQHFENRSNVIGCISILQYFLNQISENRAKELKERIGGLLSNNYSSHVNNIISFIKIVI